MKQRNEKENTNRTIKAAVLFGGCSSEYKVSLSSACAVLSAMDKGLFTPVMIGLSQEGQWFLYQGEIERIGRDTWHNEEDCTPVVWQFQGGKTPCMALREDGLHPVEIDVVLPVLHGKNGEDGTVQGLLELTGLPVAGCGILSSALCMDKDRAHRMVAAAGVSVPRAAVIHTDGFRAGNSVRGSGSVSADGDVLAPDGALAQQKPTAPWELHSLAEAHGFAAQTGYPLFVKPVRGGSSYGITKVQAPEALEEAIALALAYDDQAIIEETIEGFEVGCAVLGNRQLTVGTVDEIQVEGGFFDFGEKYHRQSAVIYVPARIDQPTAQSIQETAKTIYRALDCRGFARVDMFLTPEGNVVFNEVNTIPGFTQHSRYPQMLAAAGISFPQAITRILQLAMETEEAGQ